MGSWFLATGISQYLGGPVATYAAVARRVTDPVQTLPLYTHLFYRLGIVALIGALAAIANVPLLELLSVPEDTIAIPAGIPGTIRKKE